MRQGHIQIRGCTFHLGKDGISRAPSLDDIVLGGKSSLPKVAHPFEEGKKAFGEKRYDTALAYFARELKTNPKNAWACYYVGRTYAALGIDERAETMFGKAVELRPAFATQDYEEVQQHLRDGNLLYALWAAEKAQVVAQYVPAARKNIPDLKKRTLALGDAFIQKEDAMAKERDYAKRAYTAAAALEPRKSRGVALHCHELAKQYTDKKGETSKSDYRKGQALLETAIASGETNPWAYYRLGKCYTALGDALSARTAFQDVLERAEKGSDLYKWATSKLTTLK